MSTKSKLTQVINRIVLGEDMAIAELIRDHRGLVIRAIRHALEPGNSLRPFITTNDILQSVNRKLVLKARNAQYQNDGVESPAIGNGFRYLVKIATNLVIDRARKSSAVPCESLDTAEGIRAHLAGALKDPAAGPETEVENRETLRWFLDQFAPDDRETAKHWLEGRTWAEMDPGAERRMQRRFSEIRKQVKESGLSDGTA